MHGYLARIPRVYPDLLFLDLGVFHRKARAVNVREALGWSALWIALGLSFTAFVYFGYENRWFGLGGSVDSVDGVLNDGRTAAIKYLTGYVVEKSLSVENIFVIAMIFGFFAVPAVYQHRVLFRGILGGDYSLYLLGLVHLVLAGGVLAAGRATSPLRVRLRGSDGRTGAGCRVPRRIERPGDRAWRR